MVVGSIQSPPGTGQRDGGASEHELARPSVLQKPEILPFWHTDGRRHLDHRRHHLVAPHRMDDEQARYEALMLARRKTAEHGGLNQEVVPTLFFDACQSFLEIHEQDFWMLVHIICQPFVLIRKPLLTKLLHSFWRDLRNPEAFRVMDMVNCGLINLVGVNAKREHLLRPSWFGRNSTTLPSLEVVRIPQASPEAGVVVIALSECVHKRYPDSSYCLLFLRLLGRPLLLLSFSSPLLAKISYQNKQNNALT